MALMPKRVKHRKSQRGRLKGNATRGNRVVFGDFGLQALQGGWITAQTIEAGRIAAQQYVRGEGRLYVRVFPHKPITSKPLEVRMGTGKGEPEDVHSPILELRRGLRKRSVTGPRRRWTRRGLMWRVPRPLLCFVC